MEPPDADLPTHTKPPAVRWLAWAGLIVLGGLVITAVVGVMLSVIGTGWDPGKLLIWLWLGLVVAIMLGVKAACHPIRGRSDASQLWKERFAAQTEQEIQRFIQVVGESFGLRAKNWGKLRPDDTLSAISQQWFCGDGMELVELIMALEAEYSLDLPEEFLTTHKTLGDLFEHISRHAAAHPQPPSSGPSGLAGSA